MAVPPTRRNISAEASSRSALFRKYTYDRRPDAGWEKAHHGRRNHVVIAHNEEATRGKLERAALEILQPYADGPLLSHVLIHVDSWVQVLAGVLFQTGRETE